MDTGLARRTWDVAWRPAADEVPEGPVDLWLAVFADDGAFMGASPVSRQPAWLWNDGRLCCDYGPVFVTVTHRGRYSFALICAVSPQARTYRPLWKVSLDPPERLRAGDTMTVVDAFIALRPDPEGGFPALGG